MIGDTRGKHFAVIVDEAHSSQTGQSAAKLKAGLADTTDALEELVDFTGAGIEDLQSEQEKAFASYAAQLRFADTPAEQPGAEQLMMPL